MGEQPTQTETEDTPGAEQREEALGLAGVAGQAGQPPHKESLQHPDHVHAQPHQRVSPTDVQFDHEAFQDQENGQGQGQRRVQAAAVEASYGGGEQQGGDQGERPQGHVHIRQELHPEARVEQGFDAGRADRAPCGGKESQTGKQTDQVRLGRANLEQAEQAGGRALHGCVFLS